MPSAIDEFHAAGHAFAQADLAARERPLVIRGLCRDWPVVAAARESDTAFATRLAGYDNGTEVDTLLMAPEENGVIGYNAQMDGFNYRHFGVPVTEALRRLAAYSRHDGPTPGLALQRAHWSPPVRQASFSTIRCRYWMQRSSHACGSETGVRAGCADAHHSCVEIAASQRA